MSDVLRCPSCYQKVARTDFQCPRCELLLEGRLDDPPPAPKDVSIVRALMERPQGTVSRKRPLPPDVVPAQEVATLKLAVPRPLSELTPRVVANLRLTDLTLTPFEAFVVSAIDGKTRGDHLKAVLGLSEVELQAVLRSLAARGAISIDDAPRGKARPPPPPVIIERPRAKGAALPSPAPVIDEGASERQTDKGRVSLGDGVTKNRKVIDALKQVKRSAAPSAPAAPRAAPKSVSDLAAEGVLQVAIRMEQDGHIDEAVRYLERAIARSPDAAPLLNRLAVILVRDRRDYLYAERLLRRALELAPEHEVYKRNLVMVLAKAARENTGSHRRR